MIRIEHDDHGLTLSLTGEDGGHEAYGLRVAICDDPFCRCPIVSLALRPISSDALRRWPGRDVIEIGLDVVARREDPAGYTDEGDRPVRRFGRLLASRLAETQWDHLRSLFQTAKQALFSMTDLGELVHDFDFEFVEEDLPFVELRQLIPFAPGMAVAFEGQRYLVDELYQVFEGTDPDVAMVGLVPASGEFERFRTFVYDLRANLWTDGLYGQPAENDPLLVAVLSQYSALTDRLRVLQERVRDFYQRSKAAFSEPDAIARPNGTRLAPPAGGRGRTLVH